jgi:hypothetical protein
MSRPTFPGLTLVVVPLLALVGPAREPQGPIECPSAGWVAPGDAPRALTGAPSGAPWEQGTVLEPGTRLVVRLPPHRNEVAVRVRADHDDVYGVEVPTPGWQEVGRFGPVEPVGLQNRPWQRVVVGRATVLALRPRDGDGRYAVALVCLRGPALPLPLWWTVAMAVGASFVLLRSVRMTAARTLLAAWVRFDAVVALALALVLLDPPIGALAIGPFAWAVHAWRARARR